MIQSNKYIFLTIVLLLSCSISWCQNDTTKNNRDSVLISVDALKEANAKIIELEYQKEINTNLNEIIKTETEIIDNLEENLYNCEKECDNKVAKVKKERNIAIGVGSGTSGLLLLLLLIIVI